ncbi:hypothetical protein [uncultured Varibaculum sp.]|uniref:hypothetical protein n=1 Tax=uncultured Varibaculum sp. TaxID=413896 RepID=UPI0025859752|nr:hypothetical protein [uncultured Varibaculum sp.]
MAPLEIRHRSVRPISAKHAQASRFLQQSHIKSYISQLLAKSGFTSVARLALWAVSNGYIAIQENRSDPDFPA